MPRQKRRAANDMAHDGRRLYSLGDVTALTQVPRPQAQYWLKHLVIVPDHKSDGGPGKYHGFTFRNLIEFEIARRLSWLGLSLEALKGALESLRLEDPADWYTRMPRLHADVQQVLN